MNPLLIVGYVIGVIIFVAFDVVTDPPPRYDGLDRKSRAQFGFEVTVFALLWPIILPVAIVFHLFRGIGWLLGDRD